MGYQTVRALVPIRHSGVLRIPGQTSGDNAQDFVAEDSQVERLVRLGFVEPLGGAPTPSESTGLVSALPSAIAFSSSIPLDGNKTMPRTAVNAAIQFVVGAVAEGGQCVVPLVANGLLMPSFGPGWNADSNSDTWRNAAGALHKLYAYYEDGLAWYLIRDTGITLSAAATSLTVSGPSAGVVNSASGAITVRANGALSAPATVTASSNVAGTISPTSAVLSSSGSVTFTFTPAVAGSATLTFSASGLSSAALAYTVSAAATAPGQVTGLTLGTPSSTSQPLSWTAPTNGGSSIADYVVQYAPAGSGAWVTFADGASTSTNAVVTGLSESTAYDYRVAAVNAVGNGAYSAIASGSTTSGSASPVVVRLTNIVGLTESGDADAGWSYSSPVSDGYTGTRVGITDKSLPADTDGSFQFAMAPFAAMKASPFLGFKATQTVGAFGTSLIGVYVSGSAGAYRLSTGSTGSQNPNGTVVPPAANDVIRLRRSGANAYAEVSKDAGSTWTILHTWGGISTAQVWGLVAFGDPAVGAANLRGTGVV